MLDFKTDLFILREQDYGDYDKILTVFCNNFGKKIVRLRGAYKPLSKLNSHLQFFSISNCDVVCGKKFSYICNAQCEIFYSNILSDIRKNIAYFFVVEVLDKYLEYDLEQNDIYELSIKYFNYLNELKLEDSANSYIDFNEDKILIESIYKWFIYFLKINGLNIKKEYLSKNVFLNKEDFFEMVYFYIEKKIKVESFFK